MEKKKLNISLKFEAINKHNAISAKKKKNKKQKTNENYLMTSKYKKVTKRGRVPTFNADLSGISILMTGTAKHSKNIPT